jgi:DNA-binding response OmpR family regulator
MAGVQGLRLRAAKLWLGPILVVDDDPHFRALVTSVLEDAGYRTVEAATGEEALEAASKEEPAAVVLDVFLPGLTGHEVCRKLRERLATSPPILFVSGERTKSFDRVGGLLVGGDDYLVKPFPPDELLARVRSLIRRSQVRPAHPPLTDRETEILQLLAEGLEQEEVADRLDVSLYSVRAELREIVNKVSV